MSFLTTPTMTANSSLPHYGAHPDDDFSACLVKNEALVDAIQRFCAVNDPSGNVSAEDAVRVMSSKNAKLEDITWGVQVLWLCGGSRGRRSGAPDPAGEIGEDLCLETWWRMCALGDEFGGGITTLRGEMGCQEWSKCLLFDLCRLWSVEQAG